MPVVLLFLGLLIGFGLGNSDIKEMDNTEETEQTAITARTEIYYDEQTLGYHDDEVSTYVRLDESRDMPAEITPPMVMEFVEELPVIVEVAPEFRVFKDVMELEGWLEENRLPLILVADKNGSVNFVEPKVSDRYDCDDYAENLQRKALQQGFLMSQQLILSGKIYGVKVSTKTEGHMGNLAIAGDAIYYINSYPPHNVVKIVNRD